MTFRGKLIFLFANWESIWLSSNASSDYMSFSRLNYPSSFASEGNPAASGLFGEYDPYVHGVNDTIWIDDEAGYFSVDVSFHPLLKNTY